MKSYDSCLFSADASGNHNFLEVKSLHYVKGAKTVILRK